MRKKLFFGTSALVLAMGLCLSPPAAQNVPLLSPAPTAEEDPVAVTIAWSADRIHPDGNAVLAVVLDIRSGYHIMADRDRQGEVQDFKPFPTRVWVNEARIDYEPSMPCWTGSSRCCASASGRAPSIARRCSTG